MKITIDTETNEAVVVDTNHCQAIDLSTQQLADVAKILFPQEPVTPQNGTAAAKSVGRVKDCIAFP